MSGMKRILVKSSAGSYPVVCCAGALARLAKELTRLDEPSSVHVVTSRKAWASVGKYALRGLRAVKPHLHQFDDRESAKNLRSVEAIARSLVKAGADRRAVVLAVGGGVVGDVAGFAAASFLRGIALVQVPTTVVAQTDSAIGGKTGVNLPEGKNLVGAFYPPKLVVADTSVLKSLPQREFQGGLAEVIKYGVIADAKLFQYLEKNFDRVLLRNGSALDYLVTRSAEIKASVVSKDEKEASLREILNFGHTFGHALESATGYLKYQHGEAVAWGMMAAALYGHEIGVTPAGDAARIVALVRRMGKLPAWPKVSPERLIDLMSSDKKVRAGRLRFVLTPKIGKAATYEARDLHKVASVLRMMARVAETKSVWHE